MKPQIQKKKKKERKNGGIVENTEQNYQESRYFFCCSYEQLFQNNQCSYMVLPSKVWEDFFKRKKLLMRGEKLFWAKKIWGCSKLDD